MKDKTDIILNKLDNIERLLENKYTTYKHNKPSDLFGNTPINPTVCTKCRMIMTGDTGYTCPDIECPNKRNTER